MIRTHLLIPLLIDFISLQGVCETRDIDQRLFTVYDQSQKKPSSSCNDVWSQLIALHQEPVCTFRVELSYNIEYTTWLLSLMKQGYPGENVVRPPHRWSSRDSILVKYCYKLLCIGLWYTAYPSVHSSQICYKQIAFELTWGAKIRDIPNFDTHDLISIIIANYGS